MKIKKIKIPIYHGRLTIICYSDPKKIQQKYNLTDITGSDAFVWRDLDKKQVLRYYAAFEEDIEIHNISHETVHLVNIIFKDRDILLDVDNDEPQAYLHGYLFEKIYSTLKGWRKIKGHNNF